ncbi:translocation/assembly module TamB domain-containing protein [Undibacterium sp. Di24W]|uniref:translocation/assembly module TamB domain-containing protein n=1 Tax=Undibacterium sp. Di24W TaxID=3413033 RepID=UPI003BEFA7CE
MSQNKTPDSQQIANSASTDKSAELASHAGALSPAASKSPVRFGRNLLITFLFFVVSIVSLFGWMFSTNSGSRFLLQNVQDLSGGQLRFSGVEGRLADHLQIDEVNYRSATEHLSLSGVDLDWTPMALLHSQLAISSLKLSSIRLATLPDNQPLAMPQHLRLPLEINIQNFAVGRLTIAQMLGDKSAGTIPVKADGTTEQVKLVLSAISGNINSSSALHKLALKLNSDWGGLALKGEIQTKAPYGLQADFDYTGQPRATLPAIALQGKLSGDLQTLRLQAHSLTPDIKAVLITKVVEQNPSTGIDISVSPFSSMPLRAAKVQVERLDPQWLNAAAPNAMLSMNIDLHEPTEVAATQSTLKSILKTSEPQKKLVPASPTQKSPSSKTSASTVNLVGQIEVKNSMPQTWDKNGIPMRAFHAQLRWQDQQLELTKNLLEFANGRVEGSANLYFASGKAPKFDAKFLLSDINLMQIDSRIRSTQIQGKLELQSKPDHSIDFQARLSDPRASLNSDATFIWNQNGTSGSLNFKSFELVADQSRFSGKAELNLEGHQAFKLQAKLEQFNPAHWVKFPVGRIDAELNATGNLQPKSQVQLHLPSLSGELAGHKLAGVAHLDWQQDAALKVDQLNLSWGSNVLTAQGSLGNENDALQIKMQAENLALFETFTNFSLGGKASLNAAVRGKFIALAVKGNLNAEQLRLPSGLRVGLLDGDFNLGAGNSGSMDVTMTARQIYSTSVNVEKSGNEAQASSELKRRNWIEQLNLQVQGQRDAHKLQVTTQFTNTRQLKIQANGALDLRRFDLPSWRGQLEQMQISGMVPAATKSTNATNSLKTKNENEPKAESIGGVKPDIALLGVIPLELSPDRVSVGVGQFAGTLGQISLENFEWTPQSMVSKGRADGVPLIELLQLVQPQERFGGDLTLGVQWDLQFKDHLRAELGIQRQQGDLHVLDADGTGQKMDLGLSNFKLMLNSAGLLAGTDAEKVRMQLQANGVRLGNWSAKLDTQIRKLGDKWTFTSDAPLQGELRANVPELQWLVSQFSSEFSLNGTLSADAMFSGSFDKPLYKANIEGKGLEFAFASEGLLFPNGELKAELNEQTLKLTHLRFSNKVAFVPKQEQFQDLNWTGKQGEFNASGEVNWHTQTGAIKADWQMFPLLQRKDRWLVVSGQANITQVDNVWGLVGKLKADAAYFKLPKMPPPSLSSDVLVSRGIKLEDEDQDKDANKKGFRTKLDLQIDMGPRFLFVGRGLNTALSGTLRLRSTDNSPIHASGSITTNGGQYEGYGQQLEIERGILNFQGAPGNPSLNIRALRKGLAVEAGVDVTGKVANPVVRLVSEPNVPDSDKISWLVLGREADQVGSADASLLLSAAGAIFGGDGSRNIPKELVQGLGFDEFSIGPSENGGASKLPSQTVAGATDVGASSNDKVVRIGWRMRPGLVLAVERGVSDASGALKLSWQLTRRIRLIGSFGTDNSVDMKYKFSFN